MAVKSKVKPKAKAKKLKSKMPVRSGKVSATKAVAKPGVVAKTELVKKMTAKPKSENAGTRTEPTAKTSTSVSPAGAKPASSIVKRVVPVVARKPVTPRTPRLHQFSYMKAPGIEHAFEVGDTVEVFCDHEKNRERIRGWVKGIVVQVDNKMVAVQFRSNVFLTDGWMVPDRILWYPVTSEHIRPVPGKKPAAKKDFIPDY